LMCMFITIMYNIETLVRSRGGGMPRVPDEVDYVLPGSSGGSDGEVLQAMAIFDSLGSAFQRKRVVRDEGGADLSVMASASSRAVPSAIQAALGTPDDDGWFLIKRDADTDSGLRGASLGVKPLRSEVLRRNSKGGVEAMDVIFALYRADAPVLAEYTVTNAHGLMTELAQYACSRSRALVDGLSTSRSSESQGRIMEYLVPATVNGLVAVTAVYYLYSSTRSMQVGIDPDAVTLHIALGLLIFLLGQTTFYKVAEMSQLKYWT